MREQLNFEDLIYYPNSTNPKSYYYIPATAMPQTDSNGDPVISLIGAGPQWFFQASAKWSAPSEKVEKLSKFLIEKELISSSMDLKPAPMQIEKVELVLKTPTEERILATSGSSGLYPYTAAFNTMLSEELQKDAVAAFNGRNETLLVRYHALLGKGIPVEMKLTGTIHHVRDLLSGESFQTEIGEWIERQIDEGVFEITMNFDENVDEEMIREVHQKLIEKTSEEIERYLKQENISADSSNFEVEMKETFQITEKFVASTDISTWFKNNSSEYIKIIN